MEELLIRYIKGIATLEEMEKVMEWIEKDSENRIEYETLMTVYMISIWNDLHV